MVTVAIVGGAVFIGSWIARRMLNEFRVKVVDIAEPRVKGVEFCCADVRFSEDVVKALKGVDIAIHTSIVQIPKINDERRLGYEVNVVGTQNICEYIASDPNVKGLILAGSWHVIGESGLSGVVDEAFGYRPDRVEDRARLYVLSKIAQELIVRYYDEMIDKVFGVIRLGTVLGKGMPKNTAANIFIEKGLRGEPITPFKHSMYRPMLYVDVRDVAEAFYRYTLKILSGNVGKGKSSLSHVINLFYPSR
ncbi:MAG: NAD(P)-dependent oxidoreductase [Thermofilaceae archaeon]